MENLRDDPEALFETLAAIEHERWSDWHEYMSSLASPVRVNLFDKEDGYRHETILGYLIPVDDMERWDRQAETAYEDLSESEKESDREQVRRYWPLLGLEEPETAQGGAMFGEPLSRDLEEFRVRLEALFASMTELLVRKRQAYGSNNLIRHGQRGILIRMSDKIDRLDNLLDAKESTSADGESIEDAYRDIIGYAALALLMLDDERRESYRMTLDFTPLITAMSLLTNSAGPIGNLATAWAESVAENAEDNIPSD